MGIMDTMTTSRNKVAPWEQFADGQWHEVRLGPEGEPKSESLRQYRRHWESMQAWSRLNGYKGHLSRRESGRIIRVMLIARTDYASPLKGRSRFELGRNLITALQLLNYALSLRMYGEKAPGGNETWAEFDQRCEALLREMRGSTEEA